MTLERKPIEEINSHLLRQILAEQRTTNSRLLLISFQLVFVVVWLGAIFGALLG